MKNLLTDIAGVRVGHAHDASIATGVTAIVLKHFGWRELTEFYQWCNYNWAMSLLSLKDYCEKGKGLAYQEREF